MLLRRSDHWPPVLLPLLLVLTATPGTGQDFSEVEIKALHVAGNVHMLQGAGGNIGVCAGEDGVFLIDDQFAPLTSKIRAAVGDLGNGPIRFVLNTHWHGDHTGGNENFGGTGSVIVAHDNVRERMSTQQVHEVFGREYEPSPDGALPVVTFTEAVTFHLNGEEIRVFHVPAAHTDGDAVVHFPSANVVHAGDVYFNGLYPFIDVETGGSIRGTIAAVQRLLELCDDETKIIPGHGPLSNRQEFEAYLAMLVDIRDTVLKAIAKGVSVERAKEMKLLAQYDPVWGNSFIAPDKMVEIVYSDLSRQ